MDYPALKAAILAQTDPGFVAARTAGATGAMADWINGETALDIWKPRVTITELLSAVVWPDFIALSIAQQQAWFAITQGGAEGVDATESRMRDGFVAIFGAASATVANLVAIAQRKATRYESMYTTDGVCSEFGVRVSNDDVVRALRS